MGKKKDIVNVNFYEALDEIVLEKKISREQVLLAFEEAIESATRIQLTMNDKQDARSRGYFLDRRAIKVKVDYQEMDKIVNAYVIKTIVADYSDYNQRQGEDKPKYDYLPILLSEVLSLDKKSLGINKNTELKVGEYFYEPVDFKEFGFSAGKEFRNKLLSGLKKERKSYLESKYQDKVGELVRATIVDVDDDIIKLSLEDEEITSSVKRSEFGKKEVNIGDKHLFVILNVRQSDVRSKDVVLSLSRSSKEFVKAVFKQNVPEIASGVIDIMGSSRDFGNRSKVGVMSKDDKIDAIGACIGVDKSRIEAIKRELSGENVDIFRWSNIPKELVKNSLEPAKVSAVFNLTEEKTAEGKIIRSVYVVVPDDQQSLAIGKDGLNARLASQAIEFNKINILSETQAEAEGRIF
ncbi:MAG: hypothetical protein LBV51_03280 [Acholeplasmatales bacterium]|jgi:N utilization substance protein A|nr:hypothetical protein [Acholeplasmatales bacterium]